MHQLLSALVLAAACLAAETSSIAKPAPAASRGAVVSVVFGTDNCPHCERMKAVVAELQADGHRVVYINCSDFPEMAERYKIEVYPTTLIAKDGEIRRRIEGFIRAKILKLILKGLGF